jgi:hypothetical protein
MLLTQWPLEKMHQVVWDSRLSMTWEKVPDVVYEDVFNEFDWVWCVKGR